jgi:hypothetical protein
MREGEFLVERIICGSGTAGRDEGECASTERVGGGRVGGAMMSTLKSLKSFEIAAAIGECILLI